MKENQRARRWSTLLISSKKAAGTYFSRKNFKVGRWGGFTVVVSFLAQTIYPAYRGYIYKEDLIFTYGPTLRNLRVRAGSDSFVHLSIYTRYPAATNGRPLSLSLRGRNINFNWTEKKKGTNWWHGQWGVCRISQVSDNMYMYTVHIWAMESIVGVVV